MPLYADHIANMYYGGSSPYSSAPYSSYSSPSSVYPLGSSYSASYLTSGGNYSSHSSLGGYSRAPLSSRWLSSSARAYSPMLSTISERGTSSPVRITSPRRIPFSKRSFTSTYTPRPVNINTADIDVSRDRFRHKPASPPRHSPPKAPQETVETSSNGPFMPRVDGKPETGIDSSPGLQRSTIRRGRTVVRLHTIRRKERDSPRKPQDNESDYSLSNSIEGKLEGDTLENQQDSVGWRERLQDDLVYKDKREKKTLGEKLVEKFIVKDQDNSDLTKSSPREHKNDSECTLQVTSTIPCVSTDRRCSIEILAEQAKLLDSLIRDENLSTATLDLSKVGLTKEETENSALLNTIKRKKSNNQQHHLKTTQSDYSLHESLKTYKDIRDPKQFPKRKSLKKSASGGNIISRLDSIKEFPREHCQTSSDLSVIDEKMPDGKCDEKPKAKIKPKIKSTVEVTPPKSPLKFKVDVTVEEKKHSPKKEIIFSSSICETSLAEETSAPVVSVPLNSKLKETKVKQKSQSPCDASAPSPEPDDGNFWDKIGKRETVYLQKRKQILTDAKEQHRRALFWFPEDEENNRVNSEEQDNKEEVKSNFCNADMHEQDHTESDSQEAVIVDEHINETLTTVINEIVSVPALVSRDHSEILISETAEIKVEESMKDENAIVNSKNNHDENVLKSENIELPSTNREINIKNQTIEIHDITANISQVNNYENLVEEQAVQKIKLDKVALIKEKPNEEIICNNIATTNEESDEKTSESITVATVSESTQNRNEIVPENDNRVMKDNLDYQKFGEDQCQKCGQALTIEKDKKPTEKRLVKKTQIKAIPKQIKDKKKSTGGQVKPVSSKKSEGSSGISSIISNEKTDESQQEVCAETNLSETTSVNVPTIESLNNETNISETSSVASTESQIIPNNKVTGEDKKAENLLIEQEAQPSQKETSPIAELKLPPSPRKPVKDEPAIRPLIATPRPLQKKPPQVIKDSSSSESSSDESSSEETDESDSEGSGEFYECENNTDGRTSTGSNDSGFDSSAPTSPALFNQIKKGADSPGAANALAPNKDLVILEQELEQSTAYSLFRKTGRFTPPARSIPRFRKYNIEDFQFIKVLGKGSFGKVLLAELRDTEYYYAVKCLKKDVVLEDDDVECTLIERKVLALGTNHPYLCHLFATFQTDSHLFFVMEYLNGGDLMFHIQQSGRFPEARARFYAAEIVSGLKFLHKRGIVYRDLKLDNILLDFEGHVRIADFGMCKLQIYLEKTADTFCGTPDYMAPEIIKGLKYNQAVDWWSFGVLLYEMLIGQSPFSGCDEDELFWSICNEIPSYPRFLSSEALSILTRLLDKDAKTRLGGTECMHGEVRDQDFFRPIHWERLERKELETPFKPRVRHPLDTQYFDRVFTGERPRLTAVEPHVLRSMDQEPFRGFSYTNPNATDR